MSSTIAELEERGTGVASGAGLGPAPKRGTSREAEPQPIRVPQSLRGPELLKTAILLRVCFFVVVPVYFMVVISLKDARQFIEHPFVPTWPLHFENYPAAWKYVGPFIWRTVFVATMATFWSVFLGSLCAFIFANHRFTGNKLLFSYVLALMMIPGILNLVPLYALVTQIDAGLRDFGAAIGAPNLRFLNTSWVLILPAVAGGQIMLVYVLKTFFESQPKSLLEAARIDGASLFQTYLHVGLPLARPIIGTMAVLNVVALWNDYVWPLVVLQQDHYTLSVGLKYMESQRFIEYGPLMAGYVIAAIPLVILFLFSMKLFIQGLSSGAIKM
jgi:ABC-type glycerol-3-phosphate transport system permease component